MAAAGDIANYVRAGGVEPQAVLGEGSVNADDVAKGLTACLSPTSPVQDKERACLLMKEAMARDPSWPTHATNVATFYSLLLPDTAVNKHTLEGFLSLLSSATLPPAIFRDALITFLCTASVQGMESANRVKAMKCIEAALDTQPDVVRKEAAAFLDGFVLAMDKERNPVNLLVCFALHRKVMTFFTPQAIVEANPLMLEELFDLASCYYPITYTPPKDEPNPVSKQALKDSIRECLVVESFAQYCFPFALEKLGSALGETKLDSIELLRGCCQQYGEQAHLLIEPFLGDMWTQVRTETLQLTLRGDTEIVDALMALVEDICRLIARFKAPELIHAHLRVLFEGVLNMCSVASGAMNRKPYATLMHHVARSDPAVLQVVATKLIPPVHSAFRETNDYARRDSIMCIYTAILAGAAEGGTGGTVDLSTLTAGVSDIFQQGHLGDELRVLCAEAAASILTIQGIPQKDKERAQEILMAVCLDTNKDTTQQLCLASIGLVCKKDPTIGAAMLPAWAAAMAEGKKDQVARALKLMAEEPELQPLVVQTVGGALTSNGLAPVECRLFRDVAEKGTSPPPPYPQLESVVVQLCDMLAGAQSPLPEECLEDILAGVQNAFAYLSVDQQIGLLNHMGCTTTQGTEQGVPGAGTVDIKSVAQLPWVKGIVIYALVCGMRTDVGVTGADSLVTLAMQEGMQHADCHSWVSKDDISGAASLALASVLNKRDIPQLVDEVSARIDGLLSTPPPKLGAVIRGVLMRGGEAGWGWVDKVVQAVIGGSSQAAALLGAVVAPERSLSPRLGHRSRLLWHQRLHTVVLKQLVDSPAKNRAVIFSAVSELQAHALPSFLPNDAPMLVPLLTTILEGYPSPGGQDSTVESAVEVLERAAQLDPALVFPTAPVLAKLLPALLRLGRYPFSKKTRSSALHVVELAAKAGATAVPFKANVVRQLVPMLDDHKRCVRHRAAACRNAWFMLA
eukprot:Sspe_Gene.3678::Locus_1227_Transcript_1_1_Confidence_1.000_Length_2992::g.3678::m.3678/K15075/MET18, MMS19; DNA repair/transcription protein MET18/MMS19